MFYLNKLYYWVSSWLNYITGSPVMSPIVILISNCIFVIGGLFILNNKTYTQVLFYFDRLNNVSSIIKERFCISEKDYSKDIFKYVFKYEYDYIYKYHCQHIGACKCNKRVTVTSFSFYKSC